VTQPAHAVSVELDVPFHDVDGLRVVWHGHYLKYLEIARCALLRAHRLDVPDMIELGYQFMVGESWLKHTHALTYGDRFRVTAWFTETEHRIGIEFELTNLTSGRRSARARTLLVTTDHQANLCLATPEPILSRLPRPAEEHGGGQAPVPRSTTVAGSKPPPVTP
jgi:acyl-CoA thioester hydrolase